MNDELEDDIIKKCENIDKAKQDLDNIQRFEEIYSDFKIRYMPENFPKIIRDSEPSSIILNEEHNILDDQNLFDENNLTYFARGHPLFDLSSNNEKDFSKISKEKIAKSYFDTNIDILNRKAIEMELLKSLEIKKGIARINERKKQRQKIHDIIENNKKNKLNKRRSITKVQFSKIYNVKYNNNKKHYMKNRKSNMIDIYQHLFGINEDISLSSEQRAKANNIFQRLYNQGFYTKNKSQINILNNINNIKKESKRKNISKASKEILGLNKAKEIKNKDFKYDKNNIFKPIKTNMESSYTKFQFHPTINETSKKLVKNMEKSFTRITRPKSDTKIKYTKKKVSKEKYEKTLNRINSLYLNGVEKIRKKNKLKSCPPSNEPSIEFNEKNSNENFSSLINNSKNYKSSRNVYFRQIQWKKRVLLENEKKKKIKENEKSLECTFKPTIIKKSIKYLFQKSSEEKKEDLRNKNRGNSKTSSLNVSLKKIPISKNRYFIVNKEKDKNNMKTNIIKWREQYKDKKIKYSLNQRKSYHLDKFFS